MADARITQAALLVLARGVPCLTRWAQCWKITTVKPQFVSDQEQEQQLVEYSNEVLWPWSSGAVADPRHPLNTYVYTFSANTAHGGFNEGSAGGTTRCADIGQFIYGLGAFSTLEDAIDSLNAAWADPFLNGDGRTFYYAPFAYSSSVDTFSGRFSPPANATLMATGTPPGPAADPYQRYVFMHHAPAGTEVTRVTGNGVYGPVAGFIEAPESMAAERGVFLQGGGDLWDDWPRGMIIDLTGNGPTTQFIIQRGLLVWSPTCSSMAELQFPIVVPATVRVERFPGKPAADAVLVSGTFKVLQQFVNTSGSANGDPQKLPLNPCIAEGDPRYDDQAFWEQAYLEAFLDDKMAGGRVYGVDYPVVQDWAYAIYTTITVPTDNHLTWVPDRVFRFTSHDQPVEFMGETYQPCHSLAASAAELGVVLGNPGGLELSGIIADAGISEADLEAGLFDRARVEVWMVPWEAAGGEVPFRLAAGIVGNMSQGDQGFVFDVQTPGALLNQQPLLPAYTPGCRWELGSSACGVKMDELTVSGAVTATAERNATTRAHHRVFWDAGRAEPDGYFDLGMVQWSSGRNAGQVSEVKSYAAGQFTLWRPTQYPIQVGDQYEARPGCDKTPETCKTKFSNFVNYGGFPDVPGRDAISKTPDSKG